MKSNRVCCICGADVETSVRVPFVGRVTPPACKACRDDAIVSLERRKLELAGVGCDSSCRTSGEGTR